MALDGVFFAHVSIARRDLFNYCDPDESGNISMEEFQDRCAVTSGLETVPAVYHVVLAVGVLHVNLW